MVIIYEDESHIRDDQALRATWSIKGRQKQIPAYGHHATVRLLGGVNIETGEFLCMETNQCNAHAFLQFLQYTLEPVSRQTCRDGLRSRKNSSRQSSSAFFP
ncbi:transposase [Anoxybacteroides tepidamans]|uniref:transposase n=1 Tax=Anoxybacteroides tepidamans TaxID=265948 RepID=UPI001FE95B3B|nr:transposase [Anoxybacillus tepidamans]